MVTITTSTIVTTMTTLTTISVTSSNTIICISMFVSMHGDSGGQAQVRVLLVALSLLHCSMLHT